MTVDGFVLAGGASRRFGRDKARAEVDGLALAVSVAEALGAVCARVALVRRAPEPSWSWSRGELPVVVGAEGGDRHPLWGVAVALEAARTSRVVVAPCDLPGLRAAHVEALLDGVGDGEGIAVGEGGDQPLLAVLRAERAASARAQAAAGGSVRGWVMGLPRVTLPAAALRNANRPSDLA